MNSTRAARFGHRAGHAQGTAAGYDWQVSLVARPIPSHLSKRGREPDLSLYR